MRIGLIAGPWLPVPPITYGGTERVIDNLARGFAEAGHEVWLAAPSDSTCPVPRVPGMLPSEPEEMGFTTSEMSHVIQAYEAMPEVDVIHDHTVAGPLYVNRRDSVPVLTTIHGRLIPQVARLYRAMGANTGIIAISRDQVSHAPDVPVTAVIHHGMNVSKVPMGQGKGGYACFVGRMCPDKGVLEAIAIAREAGIPLRLTAKIREPVEHRFFQEKVKPILGPNEEFLGELNDQEKFELMGNAVAFLNPIQWPEPFGLVMIEALSTGTPVVGTPFGSAPEIVDHGTTGYLGRVEELAAMLSHVDRIDRKACRAAVEERFTSERMVADHLDLYRKLVKRPQELKASGSASIG